MSQPKLRSMLVRLVISASVLSGFSSCRVVEGPLNVAPSTDQAALNQNVRDSIQPSIKSLANAVETVGKVYRASMTLSGSNGDQAAEGAIFDGASLLAPSAEDELVLTPRNSESSNEASLLSPNSIHLNSDSAPILGIRSNSNLNGTTRETYDFTYSLVRAQSVELPDPNLRLTVEAKGSVDVVAGKAFFKDVTIAATIRSVSRDIVGGPFIIANMSASADHTHAFKVSFSDYIKLIKTINSNASFDSEAEGTIELIVTKVDATLTVKKLLLNKASKFNVESLSGHWEFGNKTFEGEAKITLATKENEQIGVDVLFTDDAKVSTKVFKRETTPNE